MHPLTAATVSAADLAATTEPYRRTLGFREVERGTVSARQARHWAAPGMAGRDYVVLQPESGEPSYIRFVQNDPIADYRALRTYGWACIELCVQDVEALNETVKPSAFEIIGPPQMLDFSDMIYPMQVKGLAEEVVYLTETRGPLPAYDLPLARSFVDRLFINVIAASDLLRCMDFFAEKLGFEAGRLIELNYTMLNKAFDMPDGTQSVISTMCRGRDVFLEVDQYPDGATARPCREGMLPPGCATTTLNVPSLDAIGAPFIVPPEALPGEIYQNRRMGVVRDPDGTLVELVETGA